VIALFVGALVATGTIWQVQRHFRDMRHSVLETRRERTFVTQLLEGMVSAVAAIDNDDRIRSANAAFFRIFPSATIGASVMEKLGPDDAMKMLETVTSIRVKKATYHGRLIALVEEEDKAFDVYSSPLAIGGGPGQIVTLVDATEAAAAERTLRRSESLAAVGQATTQVAHEIRNPLAAISHASELLREGKETEDRDRLTRIIHDNTRRLERLVSDVLQLNRRDRMSADPIRVHPWLRDFLAEFVANEAAAAERFAIDASADAWIEFDREHLRQVMWNLLRNAARYAGQESGAVRIALRGYGDLVELSVIDNGPGVPSARQGQLLEPFFTTEAKGTGLGLYLARELCAANRATLEYVHDRAGAHFRILCREARAA
jgi:two-component system sensor histidine kinase PilS (NtrC family)